MHLCSFCHSNEKIASRCLILQIPKHPVWSSQPSVCILFYPCLSVQKLYPSNPPNYVPERVYKHLIEQKDLREINAVLGKFIHFSGMLLHTYHVFKKHLSFGCIQHVKITFRGLFCGEPLWTVIFAFEVISMDIGGGGLFDWYPGRNSSLLF